MTARACRPPSIASRNARSVGRSSAFVASSEDEHVGFSEKRAGEGNALPLTLGEPGATVADRGIVAAGQGLDEAVCLGDTSRLADRVQVCLQVSVANVLSNAPVEEEGVLLDKGNSTVPTL